MSKEIFINAMKKENPELNIDKLFDIFDRKIKEIINVNGEGAVKLPLHCDLNKALVASVLSEYLKE